jgi:hypothetical protein
MRNPTTSKTWNVGARYDIYVIDDGIFGACQAEQHNGCDSTLHTLSNRVLMVCACNCHGVDGPHDYPGVRALVEASR